MKEGAEEAVALPGRQGMLRGMRHCVVGADRGWTAMILQGYFSSTHVGPARMYVQIGRRLAGLGVATWRVDCFGVGDSDGDFAQASYDSECDDYRTILAHVRRDLPGTHRIVLLGHCLGASIALRLAATDPAIARLVLISPGCGPFAVPGRPFTAEHREELRNTGRTLRQGVEIRGEFVAAMEDASVLELARSVGPRVLVISGRDDEMFPPASMRRVVEALPGARHVEIPGADHNFLTPGSRALLLECLAAEMQGLGR